MFQSPVKNNLTQKHKGPKKINNSQFSSIWLAVKTAATMTQSAVADYRTNFFSPRRRTL